MTSRKSPNHLLKKIARVVKTFAVSCIIRNCLYISREVLGDFNLPIICSPGPTVNYRFLFSRICKIICAHSGKMVVFFHLIAGALFVSGITYL